MATANTICYRSDQYRNWVRGSLGLGYLQEGLQAFTDRIVKIEHQNILQRVGTCGTCSLDSALPAHAKGGQCIQRNKLRCNSKKKGTVYCCTVCSNVLDEIVKQHRFNDPNWEIDASGLFRDHWQFAKCFMTTTTKQSNNTVAETDAACLLGIIINGKFFQSELDFIIDGVNDIFSQARKVRNDILHNSKLELTDGEVTGYLKIMVAVLEDKKNLLNDAEAKAAVEKISDLMNAKLVITTEAEQCAIENALSAIKGAVESSEDALKVLTLRSEEIIENKTHASLVEISAAKENAVDEIDTRLKHLDGLESRFITGQQPNEGFQDQDQQTCHEDQHLDAVLQDNKKILMRMSDICQKKQKPEVSNILLLGDAGSGKSALINTIIKALSGEYIPKARSGLGNTMGLTKTWQRFENCGIKAEDIVDAERTKILKDVIPYLPCLIDSPPFGDHNTSEHRELLELIIGGFMPDGVDIRSLCKQQSKHYRGFLKDTFTKSDPERRVNTILFVQSGRGQVPNNLIAMLEELLETVDEETCYQKYHIDVIAVITRYDLVRDECDIPIKEEKFEGTVMQTGSLLNKCGTMKDSLIYWASYNDTTGYDNPYIDNIALKFVEMMLRKNNHISAPLKEPVFTFRRRWLNQMKMFIRRLRNNWFDVKGLIVYLARLYLSMSSV